MKMKIENKQDLGACTIDHIHAIHQLTEKYREYNIPPCVAFVDYENAFHSVLTNVILTSLQE